MHPQPARHTRVSTAGQVASSIWSAAVAILAGLAINLNSNEVPAWLNSVALLLLAAVFVLMVVENFRATRARHGELAAHPGGPPPSRLAPYPLPYVTPADTWRAPVEVLVVGWLFVALGAVQLVISVLSITTVDVLVDLVSLSSEAAGNPPDQTRGALQVFAVLGLVSAAGCLCVGVLYAFGRAVPRAVSITIGLFALFGGCCCSPTMSQAVVGMAASESWDPELQQKLADSLPAWYTPVFAAAQIGMVILLAVIAGLLAPQRVGAYLRH